MDQDWVFPPFSYPGYSEKNCENMWKYGLDML